MRWSEMELKGLEGAVGILCHGNPSRGANLQKNEWCGASTGGAASGRPPVSTESLRLTHICSTIGLGTLRQHIKPYI